MRNLETPVRKYALYGAQSSIGSALIVELLSRQHETLVLLSDLNAMTARPGLRTKFGDLLQQVPDAPADPVTGLRGYSPTVAESVAGMDGVICILSGLDYAAQPGSRLEQTTAAITRLTHALLEANVRRLVLIDQFDWLDQPQADAVQALLLGSPLEWTLVNALTLPDSYSIDSLRHLQQVPAGDPRLELALYARAVVDELESGQHLQQRLNVLPPTALR